MDQDSQGGGRRGTSRAVAVTVALLLVGVVALVLGFEGSNGPPQPQAAVPLATATVKPKASPSPTVSAKTSSTKPGPAAKKAAPATTKAPITQISRFLPASAPTVLDIPSVGIHSSNFVDLQVAKDGTLDVPGSANEVGFYTDGPTPGQLGPAVIGAHVDSKKGPGIFYNLGAVKPGAKIHITRQNKSRTTFVVDKVALYPKDQFPTEDVYYGDFTKPEIRLVTCGGTFDRVKHYLDNVVVFGHLVT